jgi:hypothetical protein
MFNHSEKVPKAMGETFAAVTAITDAFCRERLDQEYAQMMRFVAAALARKRPSPLATGAAAAWAAGIAHAVGMLNFLFDSTQRLHIPAGALYEAFGVSQGTGQGRSKKVRDLLRMSQFDPHWCLPSRLHDHPMAWLVRTGTGFIVDARRLPRDQQVLLQLAGLIPYVHADVEAAT